MGLAQARHVHPQQALLRGDAEAEREAVVARAAVHVEPVAPARPEAVVGHVREEAERRPGRAEAHEAELAAVRVA